MRSISSTAHETLNRQEERLGRGRGQDHKQALAWLSVAEGKYDDALAVPASMADKEDSLGEEPQEFPRARWSLTF